MSFPTGGITYVIREHFQGVQEDIRQAERMMLRSIDKVYFARRAVEEIERGEQAANAALAAIHYEMALRYSMLASEVPSRQPKLRLIHGGAGQLAA